MMMTRMMTSVPAPMYMRTSLRHGLVPGAPKRKRQRGVVVRQRAYLLAAEVEVD